MNKTETITKETPVRMKPFYQVLASLVGAYHRCCSPSANESQAGWAAHHRNKCHALTKEHMPSGSGIDCGTKLNLDVSTDEKLVFTFSFHHMDEQGGYDGWTEHTLTIRPSLWRGYDLKISGRDKNQIKEYLYDVYDCAVSQEIPA